jgi:DNA polymerase I-like protein with 3'-5' exonuclease and polymerase domains
MTSIVFDIETNGLREEATCVHVISLMPLEPHGSPVESFSDTPLPGVQGTLQQGLQRLLEASELIGHNIINYDLPVLKQQCNWEPNKDVKITDTLVLSRLLNPDRKKPANPSCKGGPHSLEAWGYRVGISKPGHETWDVFDSAMLQRNRQDVHINSCTYTLLMSEAAGWDWSEAIELEHEVARIITQQEINGVNFNVSLARDLLADLDSRIKSIDDELLPKLPKSVKPFGVPVNKPFKVNGTYTKMVTDWFTDCSDSSCRFVGGPFTRINFINMNLGSMDQVKSYLLQHGWEPTEWNYDDDGQRTSPKLTEDSYGSIQGNLGKLVKDRLLYSHRAAQIQGWVERLRRDGRISATANTCGTNTGRFRHSNVVNVPKAAKHVFYGREMRSLFCCSEGREFVGHDASGLELRMLAHYMNDPEYTEAVINGSQEEGTDVHTRNQHLAGLSTRDQAKSFIYAFLYGAGADKIGQVVGGDRNTGLSLQRTFLKSLPALKRLLDRVKRASGKGFLKGLDGRKVWMRGQEHKALNTLLQSAGAVVMKKSMVLLDQWVREEGLDVLKVIDMHDEAQADVAYSSIDRYMELAELSVVKAGEHFNLKVPLAAEAKRGLNWAETH